MNEIVEDVMNQIENNLFTTETEMVSNAVMVTDTVIEATISAAMREEGWTVQTKEVIGSGITFIAALKPIHLN